MDVPAHLTLDQGATMAFYAAMACSAIATFRYVFGKSPKDADQSLAWGIVSHIWIAAYVIIAVIGGLHP